MTASAVLTDSVIDEEIKEKQVTASSSPIVFSEIYQTQNNIVIWQRELANSLQFDISQLLLNKPTLNIAKAIRTNRIGADIDDLFSTITQSLALREDVSELVEMFSFLFELEEVGLRLSVLDRAMCPRFHADKVPCRLITTYSGIGSQWLPNDKVNREKLGHGSKGVSDAESGLYPSMDCIQTLNTGDVALLKGELWEGNENQGLVHRSPSVQENEKRLLMTLDFM